MALRPRLHPLAHVAALAPGSRGDGTGNVVLQVQQVCKWLGGRRIVNEVSFECSAGQAVAVTGENGAGKSTLLAMIGGVLWPDSGAILVEGASITGARARARASLGYVPEAANAPEHLRVSELLALVASLRSATALPDALRSTLGIEHIAHQRIGSLSLGERRRACLAAALVDNPSLLVLDEPTNGLDVDGIGMLQVLLLERIEHGGAVVLATHDSEFATALNAKTLRLHAGCVADDA